MFHAGTPAYNKEVILSSLEDSCGVVRIVFATIALGMGVNVAGLNTIWHYGAPQESLRLLRITSLLYTGVPACMKHPEKSVITQLWGTRGKVTVLS